MKIFAKRYKTYEGARKRMLFEKAHPTRTGDFVWSIMGPPSGPWQVVRRPRTEHDRITAIALASVVLGITE
jgi:hypothetical protein